MKFSEASIGQEVRLTKPYDDAKAGYEGIIHGFPTGRHAIVIFSRDRYRNDAEFMYSLSSDPFEPGVPPIPEGMGSYWIPLTSLEPAYIDTLDNWI